MYRIVGIPHEISAKRFNTTNEAWKAVDAAGTSIPRGRMNVNVYCIPEQNYQPWMDEPDAALRSIQSVLRENRSVTRVR